ncbi:MAG: PASTA domain-containing protein [Ruminococcaceae bacterium]|nr:PASTA domain-containing protein [Oscillospiraceae bacterium]
MEQNLEHQSYVQNNYPPQKNNQNIALWICVGLLATILFVFGLFTFFILIPPPSPTPTVPNVAGFEMGDAINKMETSCYSCRIFNEKSDSVPEGHIIRQSPTAGTRLKQGETVTLYVCENEKRYLVNRFSTSGIYIRAQASTYSSKLGYIAAGDTSIKLEYLSYTYATDGVWYYIKHPYGFYGYVRSDVVRWW